MSNRSSKRNNTKQALRFWLGHLKESFLAVIPICITVSIIYTTGVIKNSFNIQLLSCFLLCAVLISFGLALFNSGAEQSMSRIGDIVGGTLFKQRNLFIIILLTFLIGLLVTVAEPDLKTMAIQVGVNQTVLILTIGFGVGLFVVFGVLRIIFQKKLNILFLASYAIVFALANFVVMKNPKFLGIAFDSGGVTTGPVTVPFILAFGAGLASSKSSSGQSDEDSFGLTGLASVGPIIAVMILGAITNPSKMVWNESSNLLDLSNFNTWDSFWPYFGQALGTHIISQLKMVALAIVPILAFFLIYNFIFVRIPLRKLAKIFIGLINTYIGLVIFLSAVEVGFLPVAQQVGMALGKNDALYPIAIVIGALFGLFGVLAEPAVHVLVKQIEEVSNGTIKARTVMLVMAFAISGGVAMSIVRAYHGFSILYYVVPLYILALGLTFVVPKIYSSMAFDSGGVASGPMASTFVMPFAIGFTYGCRGPNEIFDYGFGCVAMIALMPLIVIQLMGLVAEVKVAIINKKTINKFIEENDNQVVHLGDRS